MMKVTILAFASFLFLHAASVARVESRWELQASNTKVRFRGVSAVSPTVAWASGEHGTYARTTDGGR
ncbi:MAG TPA: hypothetical protein VF634_02510, partial [Pyrinomonadaceae bacterium]